MGNSPNGSWKSPSLEELEKAIDRSGYGEEYRRLRDEYLKWTGRNFLMAAGSGENNFSFGDNEYWEHEIDEMKKGIASKAKPQIWSTLQKMYRLAKVDRSPQGLPGNWVELPVKSSDPRYRYQNTKTGKKVWPHPGIDPADEDKDLVDYLVGKIQRGKWTPEVVE